MKKLLLFTLLLTSLLFPQLKEFDVKETTQRGGIPVNRDNPEKAAIFFYTQFDDLSFWSNYGIVDIKGDPSGGKYIVIVEPVRQTIEVRRKGYKTEMLKINSLSPMEVLYYEVLPKKEDGVIGIKEISTTIQVTPQDASIWVDGIPVKNDTPTKLTIGNHTLKVEKLGYSPYEKEISITPEQTLFKIDLAKVQLSPVTIRSNPANATVYINEEQKGTTELGLFLYSGNYNLRLELPDYLPIIERLEVAPTSDKTKNTFNFTLIRNKGNLDLTVSPPDAKVTLNNNELKSGLSELTPGKYILEVKANKYEGFREEIEIRLGEILKKEIILTKNMGILILDVKPMEAKATLNSIEIKSGLSELTPGKYILEVKANKYDGFKEEIDIKLGETLRKSINLSKNTGLLTLDVKPENAIISINKENKPGNSFELVPGIYEVEIKAETFYSESITVQIEKGKTINKEIILRQKNGSLQFTIKPLIASVTLKQNGVVKYQWEGMNLFEKIPEGEYELTAKASGFKTYSKRITIREHQTTTEDIQMTSGSDIPEGMVFVEGGTFQMGSDNGKSDEKPMHEVTVGSFMIGKYEVTQELWRSVMKSSPSNFRGNTRPVERVSWYDAVEFCNKLSEKEGLQKAYSGNESSISCDFNANGYRLPTEAEWEYAARGGRKDRGFKYSGNDDIDEVAWYTSNSGGQTNEVGKKQPNELGIYDMTGNVWEWCWDWASDRYYSSGGQTNPIGPNSGSSRVLRGGSWGDFAEHCRTATREYGGPASCYSYNGFRLVRTR